MAKSNYDRLTSIDDSKTQTHRDVYESQEMRRGSVDKKPWYANKRVWQVVMAIVGILIFIGVFLLRALIMWVIESVCTSLSGGTPFDLMFVSAYVRDFLYSFAFTAIMLGVIVAVEAGAMLKMWRLYKSQAVNDDLYLLNQYENDQHVALPEELIARLDIFPDVGAHSAVKPATLISHMMLSKKGLKTVACPVRYTEDTFDADGNLLGHAGDYVYDDNSNIQTEMKVIVDEDFGKVLYKVSGVTNDKLMKFWNAKSLLYNKGNANRDKLKGYDTICDLINKEWEFPVYEVQRPAGAYLVDTAPVNTMVLAMTRAGKGQTTIEPTIDMWTREKNPWNIMINDPKGELLKKFYVPATMRGYEVVQFNLINALHTDIYNPLGLAAQEARRGDVPKCAEYITNIAEVLFPPSSGDNAFWDNSARNAFKRVAFGLIDYYCEEERAMRIHAERFGESQVALEKKIDMLWGQCTLYNCYQFFTLMSSKKREDPVTALSKKSRSAKAGVEPPTQEEREVAARQKELLWGTEKTRDLMSLYFEATALLPKNGIRTEVANANNALAAMGSSEKTISTVYGVTLVTMAFFTDPTISTLTSGAPSQNIDLTSLPFPRRIGIKFHPEYIKRYHLLDMQAVWQGYADKNFTESLGKDFYHEDPINRIGWAMCYFKGIPEMKSMYFKCTLRDPQTLQTIDVFHFKFTKGYQSSLDGRTYVKDPILGTKIVRNGILEEMHESHKKPGIFVRGYHTFKRDNMVFDPDANGCKFTLEKQKPARCITQTQVCYTERPKIIFMVTPPHLMAYAKLLLIAIKQTVDVNFASSYMTKDNQKPQVGTNYMFDELGNLQSDKHGIENFTTDLSIGLGQDQRFTLILQTLQQLKDVYGETSDKTLQGNVANIVFLKSTDEDMLNTLVKMSGTTHRIRYGGASLTEDKTKIAMRMEKNISMNINVAEEPVISFNDMMYISERNSMVFSAGASPVWNRNEMILPMSWKLYGNTIANPGHKYTFTTLPTNSTAKDYDIRTNIPNFEKMLERRMRQAMYVEQAIDDYKSLMGIETDAELTRIDADIYASDVMNMVNAYIAAEDGADSGMEMSMEDMFASGEQFEDDEDNTAVTTSVNDLSGAISVFKRAHSCGVFDAGDFYDLSRLVVRGNGESVCPLTHRYDSIMIQAYHETINKCANARRRVAIVDDNRNLVTAKGEVLIRYDASTQAFGAAIASRNNAYTQGEVDVGSMSYVIEDAFYPFFEKNYKLLADGEFYQVAEKLYKSM